MTKDLPDFQSEIVSAAVEATAFRSGLDADKPASPAAGDIWLARDTLRLYVCCVAGAWTGFDAAQLVQGTLTLYAALAAGGYKLTNVGAPTLAADAARKVEVDTVDAKLDDVTWTEPTRALDTTYQNTTGKLKLVVVTVQLQVDTGASGYSAVEALLGTADPPTTIVGAVLLQGGTGWAPGGSLYTAYQLTFIAPPNYYYRLGSAIGGSGVAPSLVEWHEWDLH